MSVELADKEASGSFSRNLWMTSQGACLAPPLDSTVQSRSYQQTDVVPDVVVIHSDQIEASVDPAGPCWTLLDSEPSRKSRLC